ncbi:MAG: hypothetical protein NWF10_06060 [Candidatus Bathyarchaeota archaeon]|nr:hypothetical protein [Candidatus Bathyarchaeota archaeon]
MEKRKVKNEEFEEYIYKISSEHLDKIMAKHSKDGESKKVVVECFYNGHWGYWKFSPILKKVADKSGFSTVERWLDHWAKTKIDFEYNKKYFLWLHKSKYIV